MTSACLGGVTLVYELEEVFSYIRDRILRFKVTKKTMINYDKLSSHKSNYDVTDAGRDVLTYVLVPMISARSMTSNE